jgi:hypothetical protein
MTSSILKYVQYTGNEAAGMCSVRGNYISTGQHYFQTQLDISGGHLNNNTNAWVPLSACVYIRGG